MNDGEEKPADASTGAMLLLMQQISKDVGALTQKVSDTGRQNEAMVAQNAQIVMQHAEGREEIRKLASEIVDVRAELGSIQRWIQEHGTHIPGRPRMPSLTDDDRRVQTESLRVAATEVAKQTPYLESIANATESQRPVLNQIAKGSRWTPLGAFLGAFAASFVVVYLHSCQPTAPPANTTPTTTTPAPAR